MHHKLLHLHQETDRSTGFEAKSNTGPCNRDLQNGRQRPEAPCSSNLTFGTEGNRCTEQGTNIACTYFAKSEMKVNDMNLCSRLGELRETEDVLSGNTRTVNIIGGQALSSKVDGSLSSETQMPYWTSLPQKYTFLRRGTSHTTPPEGRECGNITESWNTVKMSINIASSPRLSGTGMTSLNPRFLLLYCQMIVYLSSPLLWELGTNFPQSQPLVKDCQFGVSPVNYLDSEHIDV